MNSDAIPMRHMVHCIIDIMPVTGTSMSGSLSASLSNKAVGSKSQPVRPIKTECYSYILNQIWLVCIPNSNIIASKDLPSKNLLHLSKVYSTHTVVTISYIP